MKCRMTVTARYVSIARPNRKFVEQALLHFRSELEDWYNGRTGSLPSKMWSVKIEELD